MANIFTRIRKATPQGCLHFVGVSDCAKAGLNLNIKKTKIMTTEETQL